MDIKFEKDDYKFNVRSSCIMKDKKHEKVLLSYMRAIKDHNAFLLPGGRLEILENSEEGILREIKEEVGLNLDYKLVSIEENIVKGTKFHMIEFVFYTEIDNFEMLTNLDDGWDKFEIAEIKDIDNYDIRPKSVKNLIKENSYNDIYHNVNYDWGE